MPSNRIPDAIKRVFTEAFTARDIAEPLASFDAGAASGAVQEFMNTRDYDVVAIRDDGQVTGFAEKGTLSEGVCGKHRRSLAEAAVLEDTVPLLSVLLELRNAPFLFVKALGNVCGIITRADIQKPAVRMWLFGLVTLVEGRFSELIDAHCPCDTWMKNLSEGRLQKARSLLEERSRRNQKVHLMDCLQFADKGQIIARVEEIRKLTVFASRREAEDATKHLEQLRNNLAHAQDILSSDWSTIVQLCEFISHH